MLLILLCSLDKRSQRVLTVKCLAKDETKEAWFSLPRREARLVFDVNFFWMIKFICLVQRLCLSFVRDIKNNLVLNIHPSMIWVSEGTPSA